MEKWKIAELAKMAGVSARTLHHYDKIGLLKPSSRAHNEYRWYSKTDLIKLQQITALKFFGLSLKDIKTIITEKKDLRESLKIQQALLTNKIKLTQEALSCLSKIIQNKNIDVTTESIAQLQRKYIMLKKLEAPLKKAFSEKGFKEYSELLANAPYNTDMIEQCKKYNATLNKMKEWNGSESEYQAIYREFHDQTKKMFEFFPETARKDLTNHEELCKSRQPHIKLPGHMLEMVYTKEFIKKKQELKETYSEEKIELAKKEWIDFLVRVKKVMHKSPRSKEAKELAKEWVTLYSNRYGNIKMHKDDASMAKTGIFQSPEFWIEEAKKHL